MSFIASSFLRRLQVPFLFIAICTDTPVMAFSGQAPGSTACSDTDLIHALSCLDKRLAEQRKENTSPYCEFASAVSRYNLHLANEEIEDARKAIDDSLRLNDLITDPAEQGRNYVELMSLFAFDPNFHEDIPAPGAGKDLADLYAKRLPKTPTVPGDESLLAMLRQISGAITSSGEGTDLSYFASIFVPTAQNVQAALTLPLPAEPDNLCRLARRVSLILLAERAFLWLHVNEELRSIGMRLERAVAGDVLAPQLQTYVRIFGVLTEFGRNNFLAIGEAFAKQTQQEGDLEGAAAIHELSLKILRSLPPGSLSIQNDFQVYTSILLTNLYLDLARDEDARKILNEALNKVESIESLERKAEYEGFLSQIQERLRAPFAGHTEGIQAVAASPDGTFVVTAGHDGSLRFWSSAGKLTAAPRLDHADVVYAVAVSPAGDFVASGGEDGSIRFWRWDGSVRRDPLGGNGTTIFGLAFSPRGDLLASSESGGFVRLWPLEGTAAPRSLTGHEGNVYAVAFSPSGDLLVSVGQEGTLRLWRPDGSPVGEPLRGHVGAVFSVAFSPRGDLLASAGKDGSVRLWDLTGGKYEALWGHLGEVISVAFSPQGDLLVSSGADGTIRLWDVDRRRQIDAVLGHEGNAWSVSFPGRQEALLSAGEDNTVRSWRIREGQNPHLRFADGRPGPAQLSSEAAAGWSLGKKAPDLFALMRRLDDASRAPRSSPWTPLEAISTVIARFHLYRAGGYEAGLENARDLASRFIEPLSDRYDQVGLFLELSLINLLIPEEQEENLNSLRELAAPLLDRTAREPKAPGTPQAAPEIPSSWLLTILSDQLSTSPDGTAIAPLRLGDFATAFIRLSKELRCDFPVGGNEDFKTIVTTARKANTLLLAETLFLERHDAIFTPGTQIDLTGFTSLPALYKAMLGAMTFHGREMSIDLALSIAEQGLLTPAAYGASAEILRMIAEILEGDPTVFDKAPIYQARAVLQLAYLNITTGQILSVGLGLAEAEALLAAAPDSPEKTYVLALRHRYLAQAALTVGDVEGAVKDLEASVALLDEISYPNLSDRAHLAYAYALLGTFDKAIAMAEDGLARVRRLRSTYDTSMDEGLLYLAIAQAHRLAGNFMAMKESIDQARKRTLPPSLQEQADFYLSIYYLEAGGGCGEALPVLERLAGGEPFIRSDFEQEVRLSLARCYDERGEAERARPHLERAAELNRSLRRGRWMSPYYQTAYGSSSLPELERLTRKTFFDLLSRGGPGASDSASALLYYSEILRSRQLLDEIQAYRGLFTFVDYNTTPKQLAEIQKDIAQAAQEEGLSISLIREPGATEVPQAVIARLQALAGKLTARHARPVVLLEYLPVPERDRIVLYVIQEKTFEPVVLEARWSKVREDVQHLRRYISQTLEKYTELRASPRPDSWLVQRIARLEAETDRLAASLGAALLPTTPEAGALGEFLRGKSVIIIPHGALHSLPFTALRVGSDYLLDRVGRIAFAPSILSLEAMLKNYQLNLETKVSDLLLVGDPTDPELPTVADELNALKALASKAQMVSDEAALKELFPEASAVHFGSHAFYDPELPADSGLVLGRDRLTLWEITSEMKTLRARVITLGACESGLAEATEVGDDIWSLATGFFYTGSPAVIASMWLQDGTSSLTFYRSFYRSALSGEDLGTGFRRAVLEVRNLGRDQKLAGGVLKSFDSPAFWASFSFLGE